MIAPPARVVVVAQAPVPEPVVVASVSTPTVTASAAPPPAAPALTVPAPIPTPSVSPQAVTSAADTAVAPHVDVTTDKLIRTPLGPFTIPAALLSDRDKEAQYCYTQLGLKYNPDLKGEITVKLSLRTDGGVDEAVVTKRSWQGISAGEVEACVRALAHDWTFASNDPSITNGAKILTFSFTP
jgi:hypothetical protein